MTIAARTGGVTEALALAGLTIGPGLYTIPGAASNTMTLTLNGGGDPNAVFVFQVGGAWSFAAGSHVVGDRRPPRRRPSPHRHVSL